jgi:choline kinase
LLFRAFRSLEVAGCDRVVVVVGFRSEQLTEATEADWHGTAPIEFVVNPRFDLANGVSVLQAREHVADTFVITMADHVLSDDVMRLAREHHPVAGGATLLVDRRVSEVFDLDDATKVRTDEAGRVAEIGKQLRDYDAIDTGVFVCTQGLMDALAQVYDRRGDASLSEGVAALAADGRMHTLDIGHGFWQDVDTPEMLAHAERMLGARAG